MIIQTALLNNYLPNISFYGLVYILGFLSFLLIPEKILPYHKDRLTPKQPAKTIKPSTSSSIASALIIIYHRFYLAVFISLFAILGGRLFYVLFYDLSFYLQHPEQILALNFGGMSYHGGVFAIFITLYCLDRPNFLKHLDLCCICALMIIPLGRIANFFNAELYGTITNVPWAFIFSTADLNPRHPVQLYEAITEGPILAILIYIENKIISSKDQYFGHQSKALHPGYISALYIINYSSLRFLTEFFRQPDQQLGYILYNKITLGQIFCAIFFIGGLIFLYWLNKSNRKDLNK